MEWIVASVRAMDCLLPRSALHLARPHDHGRLDHVSTRANARCCSSSSFPSQEAVFTATRLNASVLRIMGPGSNFNTGGLGNVLAVDEFFVHPFQQQEKSAVPYQAEVLTYFLEEKVEGSTNERESDTTRHGIQVFFQTCKTDDVSGYANNGFTKPLSLDSHVREALSTETLLLESGDSKGGAKVRVIAGRYENILSPVPFQDFVLLDILMRPGSEAKLPVNPLHGLIVYILEGVGIFNRNGSIRPFYENEGHGIWFPPLVRDKVAGNLLHVSCHLWSSLRFLVLESRVG